MLYTKKADRGEDYQRQRNHNSLILGIFFRGLQGDEEMVLLFASKVS